MTKKVRIKKRKVRILEEDQVENTDKKNTTTQSNKTLNCNPKTPTNYLELGLDRFSYTDFILLSSLLAYSIGEELNDSDLDLLIVFFSMVSSDLALIRTKRGVFQRQQAANVATDTVTLDPIESVVSDLSRKTKVKKKSTRKRVTK